MAQRSFSAEIKAITLFKKHLSFRRKRNSLATLVEGQPAKQITSFWAVNMLVADIDVKLIPALRLREEVSYLFADEDYQSAPIEPTSANILSDSIEVANGTEPGLRAINAPPCGIWAIQVVDESLHSRYWHLDGSSCIKSPFHRKLWPT